MDKPPMRTSVIDEQGQCFIKATRELGVEDDEKRFKANLSNIARADVPPEDRRKPKCKKKSAKSAV